MRTALPEDNTLIERLRLLFAILPRVQAHVAVRSMEPLQPLQLLLHFHRMCALLGHIVEELRRVYSFKRRWDEKKSAIRNTEQRRTFLFRVSLTKPLVLQQIPPHVHPLPENTL